MDANKMVEEILSELPYTVVFKNPECKVNVPVISFFTLSEVVSMMADNRVLLKDITVQIDVWAKNPMQCRGIEDEISEIMDKNGWMKIFAMDNEKKSEVFNRSVKYVKVFTMDE